MRGLFLIVIFVASVYFFINHQKHKQQEQKKVEEVKKVIRKEEFKNIDPSLPDYITNEYMLQFSKTTIETLRKLVYDTNENVRFAAIELLWQLKDRDIQKIIKKALDTETEAEIKIKIIDMLSKEKSRLSLHLIAHALNNYEKDVRARACEVMGDFIDRQTIDLLTPALKDYDEDVRKKALESIKKVKSAIEEKREEKLKEILEPEPKFITN